MPKSISLQALRRNLSRVIGDVSYAKEAYLVETYGRPVAVLLSIDEYQRLQTIPLAPPATPVRILSPRLADRAQARDFELEVVEPGPHA